MYMVCRLCIVPSYKHGQQVAKENAPNPAFPPFWNKFASALKGPRALRSFFQRPPPRPKFCRPPPHPCRLDPKSCPAGLEIFGVRRRPAPWVHFCRKCADNLKSMTSWWPGLPDVSETRLRPSPTSNPPAGQACQPNPPSLRPKLV